MAQVLADTFVSTLRATLACSPRHVTGFMARVSPIFPLFKLYFWSPALLREGTGSLRLLVLHYLELCCCEV